MPGPEKASLKIRGKWKQAVDAATLQSRAKKLVNTWAGADEDSLTWRSFKDVGVAGVDAAMDKKSPKLRRVLWAVVLVICLSLMLAQCMDRVMRYIAEPVNVNVRITRSTSLEFPTVTVCHKSPYNITKALELLIKAKLLPKNATGKMVKIPQLAGLNGMTSTDIWTDLALDANSFIPECWFGRGITCDAVGKWSLTFTTIGPCYTYQMENARTNLTNTFNNLNVVFQDQKDPSSVAGVRVVLHEPGESPSVLVRTDSMSADFGWARDVKLELRKFQTLNTKKNPCSDDPEYSAEHCISECFQSAVAAVVKCRLPFMNAGESSADTFRVMRYLCSAFKCTVARDNNSFVPSDCNNPDDYAEANDVLDNMLNLGGWRKHDCDCLHECQETTFLSYPENVAYDNNKIRIRVFYTELVFEDIQEEFAYTMIALLCDIGGTLGLMMGASVLTVCELLEVAWSRLLRLFCLSKNTTEKPIMSVIRVKPAAVVPKTDRLQQQADLMRQAAIYSRNEKNTKNVHFQKFEDSYFGERIVFH
ncbi:acid-sensing ion channel 1C-like isoform X1 [Cloeon dipterum]|uniref:acid-sensing ion channel 1C-like isoform X1 n=1 Tax=Cloeon dipterum TaxID=197152 RepID=UPI0032208418